MAKPLIMTSAYLDGKECFYLLYKTMGTGGSLNKLAEHLKNKGIYNMESGEAFSTSAIFQSIWRWALNNLDEAEPVFKNYILSFGDIEWSDEKWKEVVALRVEAYFTKAQARRFFRDNPEYATQ